ncbi:unnamed protein product [Echinostoma caproni]|uniref:Uncharacterized protein n=1 Tax=Echinostoma caproni TaxID=27848 RepID=A0A3P8L9J3_9TREM|nr:unnamed protein product [Echinostoma caproni]
MEKHCEELKQQVYHQAELLERLESQIPAHNPPISEHTPDRWQQERAGLMEHQSELEAALCRQAEQLNVLKVSSSKNSEYYKTLVDHFYSPHEDCYRF